MLIMHPHDVLQTFVLLELRLVVHLVRPVVLSLFHVWDVTPPALAVFQIGADVTPLLGHVGSIVADGQVRSRVRMEVDALVDCQLPGRSHRLFVFEGFELRSVWGHAMLGR